MFHCRLDSNTILNVAVRNELYRNDTMHYRIKIKIN